MYFMWYGPQVGGTGILDLVNGYNVQYTANVAVGTAAVPKKMCTETPGVSCLPPPQATLDVILDTGSTAIFFAIFQYELATFQM